MKETLTTLLSSENGLDIIRYNIKKNISIFDDIKNIKYIVNFNTELIFKYFEYMITIKNMDAFDLITVLSDEERTDELYAIAVFHGLDMKSVPKEKLTINFYIILLSEDIEWLEDLDWMKDSIYYKILNKIDLSEFKNQNLSKLNKFEIDNSYIWSNTATAVKELILNKQDYINILYALSVQNGLDIQLIPKNKLTIEFYKKLISVNPELINKFSEEISSDIYISLLFTNPNIFEFIPINKRTTELCLTAMNFDSNNTLFFPEENKTEDFLEKIIDLNLYKGNLSSLNNYELHGQDPSYFNIIINNLTNNNPSDDIYIKALRKKLIQLFDIPEDRRTKNIIKEALTCNVINIDFIGNEISCDPDDNDYQTRYLRTLKKLSIIIYAFDGKDCFENLNHYTINNINTETIYYSSLNSLENDDHYNNFINKKYCWMSDSFDQAILHLFNGYRPIKTPGENYKIQPIISRFTLKPCRIIESIDKNNSNIFNGILKHNVVKCINYLLGSACEKYEDDRNYEGEGPHFSREDNVYILYILEELNKYLDESEKICGYTNYFDQKETGIVNFNTTININSLKISKILKFMDFEFPLPEKEYKNIYSFSNNGKKIKYVSYNKNRNYPMKTRMFPNIKITIKYENFDNSEEELTYVSDDDLDTYFKNKYLKYKNKYVLLKNNVAVVK
jgi:hypothetical protein